MSKKKETKRIKIQEACYDNIDGVSVSFQGAEKHCNEATDVLIAAKSFLLNLQRGKLTYEELRNNILLLWASLNFVEHKIDQVHPDTAASKVVSFFSDMRPAAPNGHDD